MSISKEVQLHATNYIRDHGGIPIPPTYEGLLSTAHKTYEAVVKRFGKDALLKSDGDLAQLMVDAYDDNMYMLSLLISDAARSYLMWQLRWAQSGFPRITWGDEKVPLALMATAAGEDVESMVKPPWRAFLMDLPRGLLFTELHTDEEHLRSEFIHAAVESYEFEGKLRWNTVAFGVPIGGERGAQIWNLGLHTKELLIDRRLEGLDTEFDQGLSAHDEKINALVQRLLAGACLLMSDPRQVRKAKHTKKRGRHKGHPSQDPPTTYVVGLPIEVNVRPALQAYLERKRKGSAPSVRVMVRGHWKMQPHGEGHLLRKAIHITPYWRGPEGAPGVLREHVVGDAASSQVPAPPRV